MSEKAADNWEVEEAGANLMFRQTVVNCMYLSPAMLCWMVVESLVAARVWLHSTTMTAEGPLVRWKKAGLVSAQADQRS